MKIQNSTRWYRSALSIALRPLALSCLLLAGCASTPSDRGSASIGNTVAYQYQLSSEKTTGSSWQNPPDAEALEQSLSAPLKPENAVQIALRNNPKMRTLYGELGIAQAELLDATRIENPSFHWMRLKSDEGDLPLLTFGLSQSVTDLLMLGARRKLATGNLQRSSLEIQAQVAELIFDSESAYWNAVGGESVRAMRALVAESAKTSSDLAERFFSAGNINRVQRAQENAAAAEALIALKTAERDAQMARGELALLLGLDATDTRLRFAASLPTIAKAEDAEADLQALAQNQRGDLAAARVNVALLTTMLRSTKRWRWLGSFEIEGERERETDGEKLRGIGFSLGLPIFNQGQGRVLHAQALLEIATAQQSQHEAKVRSDVAMGVAKLASQRDIVSTYRDVLVPAREAAVAEMQKRYNFMLVGAFELLVAKQEEYDAYQGYLDALRDYWLARSELKRSIGGELPSSRTLDLSQSVGLPMQPQDQSEVDTPMDHGAMDHSQMGHGTEMDTAPAAQSVAPKSSAGKFVCPMHSDITSDQPGKCSICGMALEAKTDMPMDHSQMDHGSMDHGAQMNAAPTQQSAIPEANGTQYVCPMHADVTSDKPGECPICGMDLEPKIESTKPHQHQPKAGETP